MRSRRAHAEPVVDVLAERAALATSDPAAGSQVRTLADRLLDRWAEQAGVPNRYLGYKPGGNTVGLLRQPGEGEWTTWTCPTSLREVEPGVRLLLSPGIEPLGGDPPYEPPPQPEGAEDIEPVEDEEAES